jgi:hypothetical protein
LSKKSDIIPAMVKHAILTDDGEVKKEENGSVVKKTV